MDSPINHNPKTMPSAKKIMGTVFWDAEGCVMIEFLEPEKTINVAYKSRHYSSFVVHYAINVPEERSSFSTMTLGLTLLV
jgi:hypothetical protein